MALPASRFAPGQEAPCSACVAIIRPPPKNDARSRLRLEALEDRCTPATFTVTNNNDAGAGSLRDAIALANAAPTAGQHLIQFDNALKGSTIGLASQLPTFTKNIYLAGPVANAYTASPNDVITIVRQPVFGQPQNYRLMQVGTDSLSTIAGLILTGGFIEGVGGAILSDGELTVTGCWIKGNHGRNGSGGIRADTGSLFVYDSTFDENTAGNPLVPTASGGAIGLGFGVTSLISDSVFYGNTCTYRGGAIYYVGRPDTSTATLTIDNSVFNQNAARTEGGAIYCGGGSNLTLTGGTWIYWNAVTDLNNGKGGAIYITGLGSNISYIDVTIEDNTAATEGGVYRTPDTTRYDGVPGVDPGVTWGGGNNETVDN